MQHVYVLLIKLTGKIITYQVSNVKTFELFHISKKLLGLLPQSIDLDKK